MGGSDISIVGRLPDPADDDEKNNTDFVTLQLEGMDFCDTDASRGNVWFESRNWFPEAGIRLGQSGVVLGCCALAFVLLLYTCGKIDEGKKRGQLFAIFLPVIWGAWCIPLVAFMWLGGLGVESALPGFKPSNWWATNTLLQSPQGRPAFASALICFFTYFVLAVGLPAVYLVVTVLYGHKAISMAYEEY